MVAILLAAAFVGIPLVEDDADAAITSNVTIGTGTGEYFDGNDIVLADGKMSGTLAVKSESEETYKFTLVISGLITGQSVYYTYKDASFVISGEGVTPVVTSKIKALSDPSGIVKIPFEGDSEQISKMTTDFKFIVTSADASTEAVFNEMYASIGQTIEFDLQYSGDIIEIWYVVGDLTYVKTAMADSAYTLVTLDALNAPTPERQKFVGWKDKDTGNTLPAGSSVVFDRKAILTAVFEALPEAVITFVDGTSTLKSINVSDLSEKTVPSVEKTGYTFDGWFMGDVKVDPLTYVFEESVTLVAQWTPINCYVTFVAGDFAKTVPVLYGDKVQAPALPEGFESWDFDFAEAITKDLTITAIEKAPEKPTGFDDPTVKMALVVVGLFVCVLLAVVILKREDIRAGMVRRLSKADDKEDKKE